MRWQTASVRVSPVLPGCTESKNSFLEGVPDSGALVAVLRELTIVEERPSVIFRPAFYAPFLSDSSSWIAADDFSMF